MEKGRGAGASASSGDQSRVLCPRVGGCPRARGSPDVYAMARTDAALTSGHPGQAFVSALVERLAATSKQTILEYQQRFDQLHGSIYRWDVWAADRTRPQTSSARGLSALCGDLRPVQRSVGQERHAHWTPGSRRTWKCSSRNRAVSIRQLRPSPSQVSTEVSTLPRVRGR
ncbi:DUF4240 domain-containing protein [Streptomyces fagopyri]|uniref:DUF4240 domain-containing protein n=1 Tax=Streptomyces fagopyri TaxID=2662397 RepID=UPI0036940268